MKVPDTMAVSLLGPRHGRPLRVATSISNDYDWFGSCTYESFVSLAPLSQDQTALWFGSFFFPLPSLPVASAPLS